MRILDIEKLFKQDNTLDKVLDECEEDFNKIDYYAGIMKNNITDNPEEVKKALTELTGTFSNLRTVLAIAETEKKNRHIRFKENLRIEIGKNGGKYVDSKAEVQASANVSKFRRIRNIILAYKESAEKAISSLQSILRYMAVEYNQPQN